MKIKISVKIEGGIEQIIKIPDARHVETIKDDLGKTITISIKSPYELITITRTEGDYSEKKPTPTKETDRNEPLFKVNDYVRHMTLGFEVHVSAIDLNSDCFTGTIVFSSDPDWLVGKKRDCWNINVFTKSRP